MQPIEWKPDDDDDTGWIAEVGPFTLSVHPSRLSDEDIKRHRCFWQCHWTEESNGGQWVNGSTDTREQAQAAAIAAAVNVCQAVINRLLAPRAAHE